MTNAAQVRKALLSLSPEERAQMALAAWESIEGDPAFASDRMFDPDGVALARSRKEEIDSGRVKTISYDEFFRRTDGNEE